MKKFITSVLFFVFFIFGVSTVLKAQNRFLSQTHEINVGYGLLPIQEIATLLSEGIIMSSAGQEVKSASGSGVFSAGYRHGFTPRLSVGLSGFWGRTTVAYEGDSPDSKWNIYGLMANGKFNYINKPTFKLYGHGALGYAHYANKSGEDHSDSGMLAFQVSPVGIKVGNRIAFFTELGFGYLGLIHAGLALNL